VVTAQALTQAALNGLILGMIYVAIAIGLTIIFGMLRLVNFAHGAFYGIGAYVGLVVAQRAGFGTALIVAPLVVALLALALDRIVLRRFYHKEPTSQILLTFGIALVVEEALRMMFGGTTQQYPLPSWLGGSIAMAGLHYTA
jgi:branched-chain amino acid transport system permease protein